MHSDPERLEPGRVAVIGPGRAGTLLTAALIRAGHRIVAVAGGSPSSRERFLDHFAGVRSYDRPDEAVTTAELVLLTVPDDAVGAVVTDIAAADGFRPGQYVVHTSGSHGLAALRRAQLSGARTAACHPAQTFPTGITEPDRIVGAAWAVTASPDDRAWAHDLVEQLGGVPHDLHESGRVLYHAGLAIGSNAVGAAVATARQLLRAAGVDDPTPFLAPLVAASVQHVLERGAEAITGPVVRGDTGTVERHLAELDEAIPTLATAYRHLTAVILGQVRSSLDPDVAARLEALLEASWNA